MSYPLLLSCIYLLLVVKPVCAQDKEVVHRVKQRKDVEILYNRAHSEQNLSLNYTHYFGRHAVFGGIKLHFSTKITANNSLFEEWTFYTASFEDRIGLNVGYKYELLRPEVKRIVRPYVFYQLQFPGSLSARRTYTYTDPNNPTVVQRETLVTQIYNIFENTAGIGITSRIYKGLSANVSTGLGAVTFVNRGVSADPDADVFTERAITFRAGLLYQFGGY